MCSGGGVVIAYRCIPSWEPTRLQRIVLSPWPRRRSWLKSVGHKTKQKGMGVGKGPVGRRWGNRSGREMGKGSQWVNRSHYVHFWGGQRRALSGKVQKKKKDSVLSVNREMYTVLWVFRVKPGGPRHFLRRDDTRGQESRFSESYHQRSVKRQLEPWCRGESALAYVGIKWRLVLTNCEEQETLQSHVQDLHAGFNMTVMGGNQVFSST